MFIKSIIVIILISITGYIFKQDTFLLGLSYISGILFYLGLIALIVFWILKKFKNKEIAVERRKKVNFIVGISLVAQIFFSFSGIAVKTDFNKVNYSTNFEGKIAPEISEKKIKLNIEANVPDGAIFETTLMGKKGKEIAVTTQNIAIKDGKGELIVDISDWNYGYLTAISNFKFNSNKFEQPENIKVLYGKVGERMEGTFAIKNTSNGYNGVLKYEKIAYPNFEFLKENNEENFRNIIKEILSEKTIKNLIVDVKILDLDRIEIIVSKKWYYLSKTQKQQLAEQLAPVFRELAAQNYQIKNEIIAPLFFMNSAGEEVASPNMFGGYDIKE